MKSTTILSFAAVMAATATMAQNTLDPRMEKLDRGLIVMQAASGTGNFISWRMLGSDDEDRVSFDLLQVSMKENTLFLQICRDAELNHMNVEFL